MYSVILAPQILENIGDHPDLMQADRIHPNENGQKIMLENVLKVYDFKSPRKEKSNE
jgi:lysophospholipase L1-like esterase